MWTWLEGKKTKIAAAFFILAGVLLWWFRVVDDAAAVWLIGAGLSVFGMADKADRYAREAIAVLQQVRNVQDQRRAFERESARPMNAAVPREVESIRLRAGYYDPAVHGERRSQSQVNQIQRAAYTAVNKLEPLPPEDESDLRALSGSGGMCGNAAAEGANAR